MRALQHDLSHPRTPAPRVMDLDWVAVDTETTGLGWTDRVVELAAVRFRGSTVIDRFHTLVNPLRKIPPAVTAIHGITDALVDGAPVAREVLPALARFCRGATGLAHYAVFDRGVLATEWVRTGLAVPPLRMYCTVALARAVWPELPRHGLGPLTQALGFEIASPHRALADADATRRVFLAAVARLGTDLPRDHLDGLLDRDHRASLTGVTMALTTLPHRVRGLRRAIARGTVLTVDHQDDAGGITSTVAVPLAVYTHGGASAVDLRDPSPGGTTVTTVDLAKVTRVQ